MSFTRTITFNTDVELTDYEARRVFTALFAGWSVNDLNGGVQDEDANFVEVVSQNIHFTLV